MGFSGDSAPAVTLSGASGTNAGSYAVTASINNSNYYLVNPANNFTIGKATLGAITWGSAATGDLVYNGKAHTPTASNTVKGITGYTYSGDNVNAGNFKAIALYDTANYTSTAANTEHSYTIERREITASEIEWSVANNATLVYNGENQAPTAKFIFNGVTYNLTPSLANAINASSTAYTSNITAGDYGVNFKLVASTVSFTIDAKEIGLDWSEDEFTYNGSVQMPTATATGLINGDTLNITVTLDSGSDGTGAGSHTVTATLPAGTTNYKLPADASYTYDIEKGELVITWNDYSNLVYDGTEKTVTATVSDGTLTLSGEKATNAGKYKATATLDATTAANYTLKNAELEYEIAKGTISFTYNHDGSDNVLTHAYTGNAVTVSVEASINGGAAAAYTDFAVLGDNVNAGKFIVLVNYDTENYKIVDSKPQVTYTITALEIDGSALVFKADGTQVSMTGNAISVTYTGKEQVITVEDANGVEHKVTIGGNTVNAGTFTVDVKLASGNYAWQSGTAPSQITVTIAPFEITSVNWKENSLTYNGKAQAPEAYFTFDGKDYKVAVSGTQTNAGEYNSTNGNAAAVDRTAFASDYSNFTLATSLTNENCDFTIGKANVSVSWSDATKDYTGSAIAPTYKFVGSVVPAAGDVELSNVNVINAGTYSLALVEKTSGALDNFELLNNNVTFVVNALKVTFADVKWYLDGSTTPLTVDTDGTYHVTGDGSAHTLTGKYEYSTGNFIDIILNNPNVSTDGVYTLTALQTSSVNYVLDETTVNEVKFTVASATGYKVTWNGLKDLEYNGSAQAATASINVGAGVNLVVTYEKLAADGTTWNSLTGASDVVDAGKYRATATNKDASGNTYVITGDLTQTFEIEKKDVEITWSGNEVEYGTSSYTFKAEFDLVDGTTVVIDNSNQFVLDSKLPAVIGVGEYEKAIGFAASVSYPNYNLVAGTLKVTPKSISANDVVWYADGEQFDKNNSGATITFMYDGKAHMPKGIISVDGITVEVVLEYVNAVNVSTSNYASKIVGLDNENYTLDTTTDTDYVKGGKVEFAINASVTPEYLVVWEGLTATYDGTPKAPTAYIMVNGQKVNLDVTVSSATNQTNAGTYTATATNRTGNTYTLVSNTATFVINPKEIEVTWNATGGGSENVNGVSVLTYTYGTTPNITATISDNGATQVINATTVLTATSNAGLYTNAATITAVHGNYRVTNTNVAVKILPKEITVNNITWYNAVGAAFAGNATVQFSYDGSAKLPTGVINIDGNVIQVYLTPVEAVKINGGTDEDSTHTTAADYTAKISGISNSNYVLTDTDGALEVKFVINEGNVTYHTVTWAFDTTVNNTNGTYDGKKKKLKATIQDNTTTVELDVVIGGVTGGEVINAGDYTAVAQNKSGDSYALSNSSYNFKIAPKEINAVWSANGTAVTGTTVKTTYGNVPNITATYEDTDGVTQNLTVSTIITAAHNVGTYANAATAVCTDKNYKLMNPNVSVEVEKKVLDPKDFTWFNDKGQSYKDGEIVQFTYDGNKKLPFGEITDGNNIIRVTLNSSDAKTDVTKDTTTAGYVQAGLANPCLSNPNYTIADENRGYTVKFCINAADVADGGKSVRMTYKLDGSTYLTPTDWVYGNTNHIITVESDGEVTVTIYRNGQKLDAKTLTETDNTYDINVDNYAAGNYQIIATAKDGVSIYGNSIISFEIKKAVINMDSATWVIKDAQGTQVSAPSYNGQNYTIELNVGTLNVTVTYTGNVSEQNPGNYTVTATIVSNDDNYTVSKATITYNWSIGGTTASASLAVDSTGKSVQATVNSSTQALAFKNGQIVNGSFVTEVKYYDKNGELDSVPNVPGTYRAVITLLDKHVGKVTLTGTTAVDFTIKNNANNDPVIDPDVKPTTPDAPNDNLTDVNNPDDSGNSGDIGTETALGGKLTPVIIATSMLVTMLLIFLVVAILVRNRRKSSDPDGFNDYANE